MTKILLDLIVLIQGFFSTVAFQKAIAPKLGESCIDDHHCQQRDSNSICPLIKDQKNHLKHICTCKLSYHVDIVNNTEKCIYGDSSEEEKEGLTAAPIILCFMGCVIIEAFCLLAFRYWKKHRRADFSQHHTINLEAFQLTDTRIPFPSRNRTVLSFMIASQEEESTSGAGSSSPPPYSQARTSGAATVQSEEPPPTYEEAMKNLQSMNTQSNTSVDTSNKCSTRKMSC